MAWIWPGGSESEYTRARVGDKIIEREAEENFAAFKERLSVIAEHTRLPSGAIFVVIEPLLGSEAGL